MAKALSLYQMGSNLAAEVRTRTTFAELLADHGRLEEASEQLERATELFGPSGMSSGRSRLHMAGARLALAQSDWEVARKLLDQAEAEAEREQEPYVDAETQRLRAGLARNTGGDYRTPYLAAIAKFAAAGLTDRASAIRRELADALEADGDLAGALDQLKLTSPTPTSAQTTMIQHTA